MTSTPTKNDYEEKLSPIINICNESNLWQEINIYFEGDVCLLVPTN
jgi:hypothetical protein